MSRNALGDWILSRTCGGLSADMNPLLAGAQRGFHFLLVVKSFFEEWANEDSTFEFE
jgi:hypothetical protein